MESFWINIVSNKANPLYWPALLILMIVSCFYRMGSLLNNSFRGKPIKTKATVLSIGNLTVGGTGKTPVTIYLANYYIGKGKKVGIVSSGYGRQTKSDICNIGSNISKMSVAETGDELMEMAESLPKVCFSVSKSKTKATLHLEEKYQLDIIIVDDGFQHRKLFRSLDILLIDAGFDLRKESIFPLGRLRENISAANRADMIFLTKANFNKSSNDFIEWLRRQFPNKPIADIHFINNSLVSKKDEIELKSISSQSCYLVAGIGNFYGLRNYIKEILPNLKSWRQFSDHCRYADSDIDKIKNDLEKHQPEYIITTYKDYTKLKSYDFGQQIYYLKLKLQFEDKTNAVFKKLDHVTENIENI